MSTELDKRDNPLAKDEILEETDHAVQSAISSASDAPVRNRYADTMNPKKKLPKGVHIGCATVAVAVLAAGAWWAINASKKPLETNENSTAVSYRGYLETYVEGSGVTSAKNRKELGSDLKGTVTEVHVSTGDIVNEGDILMVVDPAELKNDLKLAQESLATAQQTLNDAGKRISALTVRAPFSGRLLPPESGEVRFTKGDEVGAQTIGRLVDDQTMKLELYFSYAYIDQIKTGAAATVSIPSAMSLLNGTVTEVEAIEKMTAEGARLFRVTVTINNPGSLSEGMLATASIPLSTGGVAMPSDSSTLGYSREQEIILDVGGTVVNTTNPNYYYFTAGQEIVRLTNEDISNSYTNLQKSVTAAQESINAINERIENCTVRSPISGMVLMMSAEVGETLNSSNAPCVIADLSSLVVNISVPEMDIDKVSIGQSSTITVYTDTDTVVATGEVTSVGLQAVTGGNSLTFPVVISVDNSEGTLSPDRYVDYRIQTAVAMDCIIIPSAALVNTDSGAAVFAKPAEGTSFEETLDIPEGTEVPKEYVLIPITTGISDSTSIEVISGLEEGVELYLAGPTDAYSDSGMTGTAVMVG